MNTKQPTTAGDHRDRILGAAFALFMERGYAGTSTLAIASRARVSKRDLYALFSSKQQMLEVCIAERVERMKLPLELPPARDRETLASILTRYGATLLREVSHPNALGLYRLAVAESERSPELAATLDRLGREANQQALRVLLRQAREAGLLRGTDEAQMARVFAALLWGNLLVRLLLRVAERPTVEAALVQADAATAAFLALHGR